MPRDLATMVCSRHIHPLRGHRKAADRPGTTRKERRMSVRLFVGGLSFSTSTDRLREAFARFGVVDSAAVMTDRETGRSRGFGFVEMASTDEAERAIGSLNGSSLDGRTIRVDKATPRGAAPSRPPVGDRRPAGAGPPRGPGGGFADRRPAGGAGGGPPRGGSTRPGGWQDRAPGGPGGRGPGDPWSSERGDQRRGAQRRGGPDTRRGSGGEGRRPGGLRKGPGTQRRSNDRGRRSLGDDFRAL
jgi:cold-inducible RNA-binding protein